MLQSNGLEVNISGSSTCIAYSLFLRNNTLKRREREKNEKDKEGGDTLKEQKLQLEAHDKKKMQDISKKKKKTTTKEKTEVYQYWCQDRLFKILDK